MDKSQEMIDKVKTLSNILRETATLVENILPDIERITNTASAQCKKIASEAKTLKGDE